MSDLEEFIRTRRPAAKRSRLHPHLGDVQKLRREGFSYGQVCEYLRTKGVCISISGLASYLKRLEKRVPEAEEPPPRFPQFYGHEPAPDGIDTKQRRERRADQFINPETTNPLLKRMKEKS